MLMSVFHEVIWNYNLHTNDTCLAHMCIYGMTSQCRSKQVLNGISLKLSLEIYKVYIIKYAIMPSEISKEK